MILYIVGAVFMQLMGSITRSFFGPLILLQDGSANSALSSFTEHYRYLMYSVSDFLGGIALLYLFYHQGVLALRKQKEHQASITQLPIGGEGGGIYEDLLKETRNDRRDTWEHKVQAKKELKRREEGG